MVFFKNYLNCPLPYARKPKTPNSGGGGYLWLKNVFLICGWDDKIFKKKCDWFF